MFVKQPRLHRVRATKFNLYSKEKDMISLLKDLFSTTKNYENKWEKEQTSVASNNVYGKHSVVISYKTKQKTNIFIDTI